jgi:hypothetical protein
LGTGAGRELTSEDRHSLPHAVDAASGRFAYRAAAIIHHLDLQILAVESDADGRVDSDSGMTDYVGQRFLGNAIGGRSHDLGNRLLIRIDIELDL